MNIFYCLCKCVSGNLFLLVCEATLRDCFWTILECMDLLSITKEVGPSGNVWSIHSSLSCRTNILLFFLGLFEGDMSEVSSLFHLLQILEKSSCSFLLMCKPCMGHFSLSLQKEAWNRGISKERSPGTTDQPRKNIHFLRKLQEPCSVEFQWSWKFWKSFKNWVPLQFPYRSSKLFLLSQQLSFQVWDPCKQCCWSEDTRWREEDSQNSTWPFLNSWTWLLWWHRTFIFREYIPLQDRYTFCHGKPWQSPRYKEILSFPEYFSQRSLTPTSLPSWCTTYSDIL